MSDPIPAPAAAGPKPLPTGRYVALVFGLCVLMAVIGASAKSIGEELGGDTGVWVGWAVAFAVVTAVLVLFARYVGNPTAWIICGVMFGLGAEPLGEEIGKRVGGWEKVGKYVAFFLAYFLWVLAIHWRIAGRPNPIPGSWGGRS